MTHADLYVKGVKSFCFAFKVRKFTPVRGGPFRWRVVLMIQSGFNELHSSEENIFTLVVGSAAGHLLLPTLAGRC